MKPMVVISLLVFMLQNMAAQTISNSQFNWTIFDNCQSLFEVQEVYLKVEEDPVLLDFREMEFNGFLNKAIFE